VEVFDIGGSSIDKTLLKVAEKSYVCMFSNFVIPSVTNFHFEKKKKKKKIKE
jgi:hypothetical protein